MAADREDREGRLLSTMINMLTAGASDPPRLSRGRTYARQGAVIDLVVEPGMLTGAVQGSRARPYEVTVHVTEATSFDNRTTLVPDRGDLRFSCTCPDWDDPCKHAIAVMVTFADEIGADPALLVRWRGGGGQHDERTPRAVVGSRVSSAVRPSSSQAEPIDETARASLGAFLGTPADIELAPVAALRPPVAAWGELWAEMLTDALNTLADEAPLR